MRMKPHSRTRLRLVGVTLFCIGIAACGPPEGQLRVHAVTGQVLVDGQPAPLARVVFHPQGGSAELQKARPQAECDLDGNFTLTTYEPDDGAPEGEYKVTVVWRGPDPGTPPDADINAERLNDEPDRLGGVYEDQVKTTLTATVTSGGNTLPPFELSVPKGDPKRRR